MHDLGFTPSRGVGPVAAIRSVVRGSIDGGWRNPPVRWLMLAAPFAGGVGIYAFYAFQPYLLQLYGDPTAYSVAGLAAATVAGAQIVGGLLVPRVRRLFRRRTDAIILGSVAERRRAALRRADASFWAAVVLMTVWALIFAIVGPLRQAFVNGVDPVRAAGDGALVRQPDELRRRRRVPAGPGPDRRPLRLRARRTWSRRSSRRFTIPFEILARRERASSDPIIDDAQLEAGPV